MLPQIGQHQGRQCVFACLLLLLLAIILDRPDFGLDWAWSKEKAIEFPGDQADDQATCNSYEGGDGQVYEERLDVISDMGQRRLMRDEPQT